MGNQKNPPFPPYNPKKDPTPSLCYARRYGSSPSNVQATNHVEQEIRFGSEHFRLADQNDLAVVKGKPIAPFSRIADVVSRVDLAFVDDDGGELVDEGIDGRVDIVV